MGKEAAFYLAPHKYFVILEGTSEAVEERQVCANTHSHTHIQVSSVIQRHTIIEEGKSGELVGI
jgi:sarcosine oxidase gamma subunit